MADHERVFSTMISLFVRSERDEPARDPPDTNTWRPITVKHRHSHNRGQQGPLGAGGRKRSQYWCACFAWRLSPCTVAGRFVYQYSPEWHLLSGEFIASLGVEGSLYSCRLVWYLASRNSRRNPTVAYHFSDLQDVYSGNHQIHTKCQLQFLHQNQISTSGKCHCVIILQTIKAADYKGYLS